MDQTQSPQAPVIHPFDITNDENQEEKTVQIIFLAASHV